MKKISTRSFWNFTTTVTIRPIPSQGKAYVMSGKMLGRDQDVTVSGKLLGPKKLLGEQFDRNTSREVEEKEKAKTKERKE